MDRQAGIGGRSRKRGPTLVLLSVSLLLSGCALAYWPVDGTMSSPFGLRFRGLRPEIHEGVDISVPAGTPVLAMRAGTVVHAGPLGGYGLTVILDHGGRTRSLYGHLSNVEVEAGNRVESRQRIGLSGQTGNATGPHLHFEIRRRGRAEDPVLLLGRGPRETGSARDP